MKLKLFLMVIVFAILSSTSSGNVPFIFTTFCGLVIFWKEIKEMCYD